MGYLSTVVTVLQRKSGWQETRIAIKRFHAMFEGDPHCVKLILVKRSFALRVKYDCISRQLFGNLFSATYKCLRQTSLGLTPIVVEENSNIIRGITRSQTSFLPQLFLAQRKSIGWAAKYATGNKSANSTRVIARIAEAKGIYEKNTKGCPPNIKRHRNHNTQRT